jgi:hypothetical protein
MKVHVVTASLLFSLGGVAFAQTPVAVKDPLATPKLDRREANQEKRIDQGVASGQLTQREERRLEARETHLNNVEAKAKADGVVTGKERKHLHVMANSDSKGIHRQTHDRQRDLNHDGKRDLPVKP